MATSKYADWFFSFMLFSSFFLFVAAYEVPILDTGKKTYVSITVSFDATSQGQVAMVIYEWTDVKYLGKSTDPTNDYLPKAYSYLKKTYVCTARAVTEETCSREQLGRFILDIPSGTQINETSFWSARVGLPGSKTSNNTNDSASSFWNNPAGNPTPPSSNHTTPWRREESSSRPSSLSRRQIEISGLYSYTQPIQYPVRKTGYYCIGKHSYLLDWLSLTSTIAVVPVTVTSYSTRAPTDVPYHPSYTGNVLFRNTFDGKLPATDYPKVTHYLSSLVGLLVIEMVANWAYYRYLNSHGRGASATAFLIVVAILDAARNAMSFFMLLVVSLGLSVVRDSLGTTMFKCKLLAGAHFIFGILYAVGIVELELESTSALVLLMFVVPLAFTLSGFLLWIMYALNGSCTVSRLEYYLTFTPTATIAQLRARKQKYKLRMFERLHYILLATVVVIAIFFVVSSLSFSGRLAEDEIAQEEEDAEDYDLEALNSRTLARDDDDNATLVADRGADTLAREEVVFEIGDEEPGSDGEDEMNTKKRRVIPSENHQGEDHERQGLIGRSRDD
ncbi:hypothetical protein H0H92_000193 [Tricholoma furcatifolium]|nr:hypothetical protein H0H92_000193 [Tricholoma furcatifolium]